VIFSQDSQPESICKLMPNASFINTLVVGNLSDEYIIDINGKAHNHVCGGAVLYSAAGVKTRIEDVGLVSRIGSVYSTEWLASIEEKGLDPRGILPTKTSFDHRRFIVWRDAEHFDVENPVANYASHGLTFPRELLGYHSESISALESIWGDTISQIKKNLPREFFDISAAHICSLDFSTQVKIINLLESGSMNTLSITPSNQYMTPEYLEKLRVIVKGAAIFCPSEDQLYSLCKSQTNDIWEMMEMVTDLGCQRVIVTRGLKGYLLYDGVSKKRYSLPVYPNRWIDPTGAEDVFSGAFLSEFIKSYDPVQALIWGGSMASISVEGSGPFFCLEAIPGLAEARAVKMQSYLGQP